MTNNEQLNEFVRGLSLRDKKSLLGKCLKLSEETGELAKAILPFESAHCTNHRFKTTENILEEVADVYLTAISIAYSLGFSDDEIEQMVRKKSLMWEGLQKKEEKALFPLPFEIHVTVKSEDVNIEHFKLVCKNTGVKPILLNLELNNKAELNDLMTSSKMFGTNREAFEESERISNELEKAGFFVLRKKIETVPWHPSSPQDEKSNIPSGCYFESHIGIIISPSEKDKLSKFVQEDIYKKNLPGTAKLSRNFFKKSNNDKEKFVNMLTYRSFTSCHINFNKDVEIIKKELEKNGYFFEKDKVEIEWAIYDTNSKHDAEWMRN